MADGYPIWVTGLVGAGTALTGFGARTLWEEHRDFVGARRIVVSELRANARAVEESDRGLPPLGYPLSDSSYRNVQLTLARRLPAKLYEELDMAYGELTPEVKNGVGREGRRALIADVGLAMEQLADRLERYRPWMGLLLWSRNR